MADLIERDAAHDAIGFERCDRSCTDCPTKCTWYYTVKNIPAVNRWIPVEDALPEYGEYVLFILKNCEVYVGYYDEKNTWTMDYQWFCGENVTHWMPLPEPPEKE